MESAEVPQEWTRRARAVTAPFLVHAASSLSLILVCVWTFRYRGGLSLDANDPLIFNWHPLLMVAAFGTILPEAALAVKRSNFTRRRGKNLHSFVLSIAFVFSVVALWAVFRFHANLGIADLYSLHSILGLATVVLVGLQGLAGGVMFHSHAATATWLRAKLGSAHAGFGVAIIFLAASALLTGVLEKLTFSGSCQPQYTPECRVGNALGASVAFGTLALMFVLSGPHTPSKDPVSLDQGLVPATTSLLEESATSLRYRSEDNE